MGVEYVVNRSYKFSLVTLGQSSAAEFVCFASQPSQLSQLSHYSGLMNVDARLENGSGRVFLIESNPRFWASLGEGDRTLLQRALNQALAEGNARAAALNAQALATLKQTPGVRVHSLSASQRRGLRQAVQPVHADFARRVGTPLLRDVKNLCLGGISG